MTITLGLYAIAALDVFSVFAIIASVGKPRRPVTPAVACYVVAINLAATVVLLSAAAQR